VDLGIAGSGAPACAPRVASTPTPADPAQVGGGDTVYPLQAEAMRRSAFRGCLRRAALHAGREIRRARRLSGRRLERARRHIKRHRSRLRRACVRRHGRTPGRVTGLKAKAVSRTRIDLTFIAPGTDGRRPPAARTYVVKQSLRPIRSARGFRRAQTLCKGRCRFAGVTEVGAEIKLTIKDLRPRTTYYYAVAARDNVSGKLGRRSRPARAKTR
ncbi:MAG: hypothetical protein ACREX8_21230, partial [Gammaproteobacteria bacterium]